MIKVLFDTNIILDVALKRQEFFQEAANLFSLIDQSKIKASVTSSTITDIYYIAKRDRGHSQTIGFLKDLVEVVAVIGVNHETILKALILDFKDFEDAVQATCADLHEIEWIITRNKKDFSDSPVRALTPKEFIASNNFEF